MALESLPRFSAVTVVAMGGAVLLGEALKLPLLASLIPGSNAMKPNSALAFVLAGVSLALLTHQAPRPWARFSARGCSFAVAMIGLVTLFEYLFGWSAGIDQLLFRQSFDTIPSLMPGRMAPNTALNFLLTGTVLVMLHRRSGFWLTQLLATAIGLIALLALMVHVFRVEQLLSHRDHYPFMVLSSAVVFLLLSSGLLAASPGRSRGKVIANERVGAQTFSTSHVSAAQFEIADAGPWDILFLLGEVASGAVIGHFGIDLCDLRAPDTTIVVRKCCKAILGRFPWLPRFVEPTQFVAVCVGDRTAGAALISTYNSTDAQQTLVIDIIVVEREFRGRGIGSAFVRHLLANAPQGALVHCYCAPRSQAMQRLLRRVGFVRVQKPFVAGSGADASLMPAQWQWQHR